MNSLPNVIISHIKVQEGITPVAQDNETHQKNVAELASSYASKFGLGYYGQIMGLLHDKGKERMSFQQYIRKVNLLPTDDKKHYDDHNHAYVGGILVKDLMGKSLLNLLANQIISHHTGLHDFGDVKSILEERQLPEEISMENIDIDISMLRKEFVESPFSRSKVDMKHFHHLYLEGCN